MTLREPNLKSPRGSWDAPHLLHMAPIHFLGSLEYKAAKDSWDASDPLRIVVPYHFFESGILDSKVRQEISP